ncbi:MAG: hypothetical protein LAT55_07030 [Opitutales bacterium]|nr:hypothetical protein [Opitutales bacterium]
MSYEVIVRSGAQSEIVELFGWYENKEAGLGGYFMLCLDASIEGLLRFPTAPRIVRHEYRRVFVKKFPVAVYYIVRGKTIYIDIVESMLRDPKRLSRKLDQS